MIMKRIILITHGKLCEGLCSAMEIINGSSQGIETISLSLEETIDDMTKKVSEKIEQYDEEDIVLALTDIAIGTTTKCLFPLMERKNLYVLCGINLPMLLTIYLTDLGDDVFASLQTILKECQQTLIFVNEQLENES